MLNRFLVACCLFSAITFSAWAVEQPLADPDQEARAYALFHEIQCAACAGESIAESPADAAADMRKTIRIRVASGDSDTDVKEYLFAHYGNAIKQWTPITPSTILLWVGPALLLITVIVLGWTGIKKAIAQYNK